MSAETGPAGATPVLRLDDAWKAFGHVMALRQVSFSSWPGEIVAVVGDNGAGKSTLMKALSGVYRLDRGDLWVGGRELSRSGPRAFRRMGISTVFQDLALIETLDVATNMFLDAPLVRAGFITSRRAMYEKAAATLQDLKVRIPSVRIPVGELSGGQRQSVAIARAVLQDSPIIIMDEPTAALGVRETRQVGSILAELRARQKSVILVSHDLEFVFARADRIQVLRLGTTRGVLNVGQTNREEVIGLITGLIPGREDTFQAAGQ